MRLFQDEFGGQVSWLIPAALLSLAALLWVSRRAARTDRARAFALLWGGWLLVTGLVFSYMQGIIHPYYMVALAPAIGALVGVGAMALWQAGLPRAGRIAAAVGVAGSGLWACVLLERTPDWLPWLRWTVLAAGLLGAVALFAVPARRAADGHRRAPFLVWAPLALGAGGRAGRPARVQHRHRGHDPHRLDPERGPVRSRFLRRAGRGWWPGGWLGGRAGGAGNGTRPGGTGPGPGGTGSVPGGSGSAANGSAGTGAGGTGGHRDRRHRHRLYRDRRRGRPDRDRYAPRRRRGRLRRRGRPVRQHPGQQRPDQAAGAGRGASTSGSPRPRAPSRPPRSSWPPAVTRCMAIGGFNGTDPTPTLAQFEAMVAKGEIHYYVGQGGSSFGGGSGSSSIASWVAAHFTSQTAGGVTVYNLTEKK